MERVYLKEILNEVLGKGYRTLSRIYGGMMNVSYLIQAKDGKKYIVYIPNGKANKTVDRKVEKENSETIAELGLTSKFVYFDTRRGIKIKEYIEGTPLNAVKEEIDYQEVADLLHLIHDSKKLSSTDYNPFDRLAIYENRALSYTKETNEYRHLRDFLSKNMKYLQVTKKVLSHNDFQRSNIVKGNDGKYYVVDFEFMANNDEIYDIAAFANDSIEDGEKLMKKYFIAPTIEQWRRFYLWRIFISLQWAVVAISKHYQKEGKKTSFNFLKVSEHFVRNGYKAKEQFLKLK